MEKVFKSWKYVNQGRKVEKWADISCLAQGQNASRYACHTHTHTPHIATHSSPTHTFTPRADFESVIYFALTMSYDVKNV